VLGKQPWAASAQPRACVHTEDEAVVDLGCATRVRTKAAIASFNSIDPFTNNTVRPSGISARQRSARCARTVATCCEQRECTSNRRQQRWQASQKETLHSSDTVCSTSPCMRAVSAGPWRNDCSQSSRSVGAPDSAPQITRDGFKRIKTAYRIQAEDRERTHTSTGRTHRWLLSSSCGQSVCRQVRLHDFRWAARRSTDEDL
jgi:hypothetical protein